MKKGNAPGWESFPPEILYETPYFSLAAHQVVNPKGVESRYFFLNSDNWVKIIPVTPEGEVVLVNQYRPSVHEYSLEVPGGVVDSADEDPGAAARRELLEETGFTTNDLRPLGWAFANPGVQTTRCFFFAAFDVQRTETPQLEQTECIEVVRVPLAEIPPLIESNRIVHSLVIAAFMRFSLIRSFA